MSAATAGWVHLTHPDTGGAQLVPDSPDVVEALEARGWVRSEAIPAELDPDHQGDPAEPDPPHPPPADAGPDTDPLAVPAGGLSMPAPDTENPAPAAKQKKDVNRG